MHLTSIYHLTKVFFDLHHIYMGKYLYYDDNTIYVSKENVYEIPSRLIFNINWYQLDIILLHYDAIHFGIWITCLVSLWLNCMWLYAFDIYLLTSLHFCRHAKLFRNLFQIAFWQKKTAPLAFLLYVIIKVNTLSFFLFK